jgi:hypothetical protein
MRKVAAPAMTPGSPTPQIILLAKSNDLQQRTKSVDLIGFNVHRALTQVKNP